MTKQVFNSFRKWSRIGLAKQSNGGYNPNALEKDRVFECFGVLIQRVDLWVRYFHNIQCGGSVEVIDFYSFDTR